MKEKFEDTNFRPASRVAIQHCKLHGHSSWEVDALPPNVLTSVITKEIENLVDMDMMNEIIEEEERDKKLLTKAVASLRKKSKKKE